jgi:hypothetical protein
MATAHWPTPASPAILPPKYRRAHRCYGGSRCWSNAHVPIARHELPFLRDDGNDHFSHEWTLTGDALCDVATLTRR